ncbi:RagB/SusD family nutrient uptake outer membrane protein [Phocaeicola sp. KGMB11183]|uniref:RagB/SusD family nutrient uptake outer membrane protein n=1 Tax=Phocaeicola acetigenes TaxID=3016083 RepID=A0ABT4PF38_9BACT|nr:RagB/SusD family nutrient uptake outer membrane protein [Phocaeicola sp. KGMB11183]MCZ8371670.1 RagB/SusD family nutrient uptake outer membrane protein [Phocaeicola sp. KGMB11183]
MKILNKIIGIGVLGVSSLFTCNCSGFLDIDNPSAVTTDYYDTLEGQEKLVIDLYEKCRSLFTVNTLQFLGTDMYMSCDESPISVQFNGYTTDLSGLSPVIDSYWQLLYKMIQESNILLNRCTPDTAGEMYNELSAQGRFFRVLAYYYLVETFGPVPLLLDENTDEANIIVSVTRESEKNIYSFMISELEDIKNQLPEVSSEVGRINNTALKHFLGKLYLSRSYKGFALPDDLDKSIELFESVIASEHYQLLPNFADVFDEDNQNNIEIIWAVQYGSDKNYNGSGNPQHTMFGFNITALYPGMFTLNQQDYSAMQRDIWVNPIVHEWFRYPDIDTRYDATFKREFYINDKTNENYGKLGIYMPRWNDTSEDSKGAIYYYPFKDEEGNYNWYPALGMMNWKTDCMPMCNKFKETKIDWGGKGTREDIIIRMADTYLLCAEAYLKKGESDMAMCKVNQILERAAATEEDFETMRLKEPSELTLDRLLEERGCELFGEHDRWFDLKRTGKLVERAKLNPLVSKYNNISDMHMVRPIPYNERIKLQGLTQNPGYNN